MENWIAVIDDDSQNLKIADRILSFYGYRVTCLHSGEELLEFINFHLPDLILLDVHMTGINGFETMQKLRATHNGRNVPVIFLTADNDADTETKALTAGASDFVGKPFVASVLLLRVKNTIELHRLQSDLKAEAKRLSSEYIEEHSRNERLSMQVVQTLAGAVDAKDRYTNGHSTRVAEYSREIARSAGYNEKQLEEIYMMGLLHDVGKIGVPDYVINKPTKLTTEEFDIIKKHPVMGYEILKTITEMPQLSIAARFHHERYDGNGYPDGLKGDEIPEAVRIISCADAYDAMSSRRSYHDVYAQEYIREEFRKGMGTQFDPKFARIMLDMIDEDKDYSMREDPETYLVDEEGKPIELKREEESDFIFGFLEMLEAGGLDTAVGMKYCMNDMDFYREMLTEYTNSSNDRITRLEMFCSTGDLERYKTYVHSLKSASKTIGAMTVYQKAERLEKASDDKDMRYVSDNTPDIVAELREISASILMSMSIYAV